MINIIRKIIKPKYEPLNKIEISAQNILDNLSHLSSLQKKSEIFPVLKSNAYGHGLKEICQILKRSDIKMVVVDSFPEAQIVYKNFKGQVLIAGEMPLKAYNYCKLKRTEFIIYNEKTLRYLSRFGKKAKIHLFVNTGMNREGIDNLGLFVENNRKLLDKVEVSGICSHLAEADNTESDFNNKQEQSFLKSIEILKNNKIYPKWVHLGNSAGVFTLKNELYTAFRPGIALYGYNPMKYDNYDTQQLKPALRVISTVVNTHKINKGDRVSYNNSFISDKNTTIAVVPFGYFEGLDRRLSSCSNFLFNKIAGDICMNLTCLDYDNNDVGVGDNIEIISLDKTSGNSIEALSKKAGMIPYETLIRLNCNIKRIII